MTTKLTTGALTGERIRAAHLRRKITTAEHAASLIAPGSNIGMSGFTGSGHPKAVPLALADIINARHAAGEAFKVNIWSGASTAPELDGALARADAIDVRLPYQSDPAARQRINSGAINYVDMHLSHVAQHAWFGFFGKLHYAVIEVTGIREDGSLIPSTAVGNNKTWLDVADKVILEVNHAQDLRLEGMHDIYYGTAIPPQRKPIPMTAPHDRIGQPHLRCDPGKIIAIVETNLPDRHTEFAAPDATSRAIAGHMLEFLAHEVKLGRLPESLLPLQSGVGNVANAVMAELENSRLHNLTAYTEVLQDGMLRLLKSGRLLSASASAISLSEEALADFLANIDFYRQRIILRPQEISNHPEVVRRLGLIAMNSMIEADIYGNVNSTHVNGTSIMNGIGGSGDFARNAYLNFFMTPSTAKAGSLSCIVPMVSHVDHTEHDVQVIVTEHGLADLRGLSPKQRAAVIIRNCAHPKFRPALQDYYARALRTSPGKHTPHLMHEAFGFIDTWMKQHMPEAACQRQDAA